MTPSVWVVQQLSLLSGMSCLWAEGDLHFPTPGVCSGAGIATVKEMYSLCVCENCGLGCLPQPVDSLAW